MQRISIYQSQMPEGAERYGVSPTSEQAAMVPSYMSIADSEPAPPSGIPFGAIDNCTAITKKGTACGGPKANDSQFCIGHLRQLEKFQREGNEGGIPVQVKNEEE